MTAGITHAYVPGQADSGDSSKLGPTAWGQAHTIHGLPVLVTFPFAFDTPDLATGVAVYTPAVGDRLVGAWVEIATNWNQALLADIGGFDVNGVGLLGYAIAQTARLGVYYADPDVQLVTHGGHLSYPQNVALTTNPPRFTSTDPLLLVVNDTGTYGGTVAVAPTQGAATLCLLIVKA